MAKKSKVTPDKWQPLIDYDRDDDEVKHPVLLALNAMKKPTIDAVQIVDEWYDDHEICLAVRLTVDGKVYEMSDWWLSRDGFKLYAQAEISSKARAKLWKEHIKCHLEE